MKRTATAIWTGSLKAGKGTLASPSGALRETPYTFASRFESGKETNPEELLAAAHSGCFAMALSAQLGGAGFTPDSINVEAAVNLDPAAAEGPTITAVHLVVRAKIPSIDAAKFAEIVGKTEKFCPVSRVLKAAITVDAQLVS